jgi:hypothetical protein
MGKKSKKTQAAEAANQAANNQIEEGDQTMEVANEVIPSTIVESSEVEVFGPTQEVLTEVAPVETTVVQAVEQAAPKPPKPSKRPYIPVIEEHLESGDLDKKGLLALIMEQFPTINKNGASTFLTDALNPKYSHWKDRVVIKKPDGKMIFADRIETPAEEAPHAEAQPEQPSE